MDEKEKIKKIYEKREIKVSDEYIENAMKDKQRVHAFMREYKQEEIDSMNYIFGKPYDNKTFTKFELEATSKIDLFNRNVVNICKLIWDNRDNEEELEEILRKLEEARNSGNTSIINSGKVVAENRQV